MSQTKPSLLIHFSQLDKLYIHIPDREPSLVFSALSGIVTVTTVPPPSLRETVSVFFGGFLRLFIPAVFEKVAGYLIDSQIVGARQAGIRPTPGAAKQPVSAGAASLIMLDTGAHGQPAHLPVQLTGITVTDGIDIIEAIERADKTFVLGLQYHPEIAVVQQMDENSLIYFQTLVNLAKRP